MSPLNVMPRWSLPPHLKSSRAPAPLRATSSRSTSKHVPLCR